MQLDIRGGHPRRSAAFATGRNENGSIVGWRMNTPGGLSHAGYWPTQDAPPVELPGRVAFEVNDGGQIVGIRDFPESSVFPFTAVMWEPARGRTTALGDNNLGSYVFAVNSSGRSAGYAVAAGEGKHYNTTVWWDRPGTEGAPGAAWTVAGQTAPNSVGLPVGLLTGSSG